MSRAVAPIMIVVLMGVAGAGKTTVGRKLAARLGRGWRFLDADDFHPAANVAKMRRGAPLTDADRAPWLAALRARLAGANARRESVVLACSALKRRYRRRLAVPGGATRLVYLRGEEATFRRRLQRRRGHYMPASLLRSQFAALEEPSPRTALVVDAALPPAAAAAAIAARLRWTVRERDASRRRA